MGEDTTFRVGLVSDPGTDAEEIDELTRRLRRRIAELDVADVSDLDAVAPAGAKSGGVAAIGVFLVTVVESAGGIRAVVRAAQGWLSHHSERTIELEVDGDRIKISGASSAAQERLVDSWIERRAGAGETG